MIDWFRDLIYGGYIRKLEEMESRLVSANLKNESLEASTRALSTELAVCQKDLFSKGSKEVYHFLEAPIEYSEPVKINNTEIYHMMEQYSCEVMTPLDSYSYGIDLEDVMDIVRRNSQIRDSQYIAETMDCDDFAIAMWGLFNQRNLARFAFGWARSAGHAFNFFVDRNKNVWVIEPQGTSFMTISEAMNNKDYKITQYII